MTGLSGISDLAGLAGAMPAALRPRPMRGAGLLVTACVLSVFEVEEADLSQPSRGRAQVALARQVAMYLHHVILARTLTDIAREFGRDRTTVAHACRLVEDRRDEPEFDTMIGGLETALQVGLAALPARPPSTRSLATRLPATRPLTARPLTTRAQATRAQATRPLPTHGTEA